MRTSSAIKTIVVSGAHSGIGKTALAEAILHYLSDWSALKVTVRKESTCPRDKSCTVCGQIKDGFDLITDSKIIKQEGTDTFRLKKAGAKKVVWLRANSEGLESGLKKVFSLLKKSSGIVIESNSALKFINPNLAIFIQDQTGKVSKSAKCALNKADIVIDVDGQK